MPLRPWPPRYGGLPRMQSKPPRAMIVGELQKPMEEALVVRRRPRHRGGLPLGVTLRRIQ